MVVLVSIWVHLALSMLRLNAASRFFRVRWFRLTCLTLISLARKDSVSYWLSTMIPMIVRADLASTMPLVGLKALMPTTSRRTWPFCCWCNLTSGSLTMTKALSLLSSLSHGSCRSLVGCHLQYGEISQVTGDGMGVSVPAESDHDEVVAIWFHGADGGGCVPGLHVGYDLVLAPDVEEGRCYECRLCNEDPCVGDVSDVGHH